MKLYILRHAIAEERRPNLSDSKRKLTKHGRSELKRALRGLQKLKVRPNVIVSSPHRRAWDTAVDVALALLGKPEVVESGALKPGGPPGSVWTALKHYSDADSVMVVGHEPSLSEFAAYVLTSPHLAINLKKSGLIRIDVDDLGGDRSSAQLRWVLTPQQLGSIK